LGSALLTPESIAAFQNSSIAAQGIQAIEEP
jgi:hypothetical protein